MALNEGFFLDCFDGKGNRIGVWVRGATILTSHPAVELSEQGKPIVALKVDGLTFSTRITSTKGDYTGAQLQANFDIRELLEVLLYQKETIKILRDFGFEKKEEK